MSFHGSFENYESTAQSSYGKCPRIAQYYKHLASDKACETKQVKSTVVILSGRGSKETMKTPSE
jgi:hypothetical protein